MKSVGLKILLDNKDGKVWNISQIVSDVSWKTSRIGKAGSLEFTLIKNAPGQDKNFKCQNGDIVSVQLESFKVFYGYIFSIDGGRDESVKIACYDQIRYLSANDSYLLTNMTASQVVQKIAADFNLKLGQIEDTSYKISTMSEKDQKLLDIICKAMDLTLINTGQMYVFYDDFGALSLRNVSSLLLDVIVGGGSLLTDYSYKVSIDDDTYNKIKLYRDNNDTGKRELYVAQDSRNIAKWGVLQLYQSIDENKNEAQINEMLSMLSQLKNREKKTLKLESLGDMRVRAGCYLRVQIEEYGINQPFLVDECTHSFEGEDHTMSLELKII